MSEVIKWHIMWFFKDVIIKISYLDLQTQLPESSHLHWLLDEDDTPKGSPPDFKDVVKAIDDA